MIESKVQVCTSCIADCRCWVYLKMLMYNIWLCKYFCLGRLCACLQVTTYSMYYLLSVGEWRLVSAGIGLNQYDPTLPHARSLSAGLAVGEDRFVISGGCAR